MKIDLPDERKPRIEMIPLIDIVFLLLVFFIYAMLSMAVHRALPVLLPESRTAKINRENIISITMKKDGTIFLDKQRITLDLLGQRLRMLPRERKKEGVMLFADKSITYQRLFRVLDQINSAGIDRISLQAEVQRGN